jgi:hypothetical protein
VGVHLKGQDASKQYPVRNCALAWPAPLVRQSADHQANSKLYHLTIPTLTPANLPEFLAKTYLLAFAI